MNFFVGNALWHLVMQSDAMTAFILIGFLIASILCWSIIFYKWSLIKIKYKQVVQASKEMRNIHNVEQLLSVSQKYAGTLVGQLIADQLGTARVCLKNKKQLTDQDKELLEGQRLSLIEDMIHDEESYLWILSLSAAVGPLVGLFGTVWGLMHAFINISEKQIADIVTMAPGIAEALLTTLGGLMLAIPTLIMFHYLQGQIREIEHMLYQISDRLDGVIGSICIEVKESRENAIESATQEKSALSS